MKWIKAITLQVNFRTAGSHSQWNSVALYSAFYRGLVAKIMDELSARELPGQLDDLIHLASHIDRLIQEHRLPYTS